VPQIGSGARASDLVGWTETAKVLTRCGSRSPDLCLAAPVRRPRRKPAFERRPRQVSILCCTPLVASMSYYESEKPTYVASVLRSRKTRAKRRAASLESVCQLSYGLSDLIISGPFMEILLMFFASTGIFIRSTERICLFS
jgi:hypothetical protein